MSEVAAKASKPVDDDECDSDSDSNNLPVHTAKKRGRPVKSAEDPMTRQFRVPVYVKLEQAPVMVKGRTHKGDKLVKQLLIMAGPFNITEKMVWKQFLVVVAEEVESEGDEFQEMFSLMTWGFQKKAQLLLTNSNGYDTMLQQLQMSKALGAAIIVV